MNEVIIAEKLTKRFGSLVAVNNISFSVKEGEIFGFLGPNGAGKTTTVRMLLGVLPPDSGKAFVLGFNVKEKPLEVRKRIGVVPEAANVYLDLTVWQNLMFMAELYGVPRNLRRSRARELLDFMEMLERRNEKAKKLSKGLRQRLLICMALIHEPKVLFLDEPTVGLDVENARRIREMLRELNREEGVTIFLTTHNMWEAEELCHRIAIINRGKLAAIDYPKKLKATFSKLRLIEVQFNKTVDIKEFSETLNCKVEVVGNKCRVHAINIDDDLYRILNFARTRKLEILSLNILQPSLEDVFLEIIRRKEE